MARKQLSPGAADAGLAQAVERLQAEVDGLRRAQHYRAVIEQAKGLLAGRLNCSPEEAFSHLTAMSQRTNMKLVQVAAGLLGLSAPVPPPDEAPPLRTREEGFGVPAEESGPVGAVPDPAAAVSALSEETTARYHLTCATMTGADEPNRLAEVLWSEGLRHLGVSAVILGVLEPDGAVRLLGVHGLPAVLVSAWQRVPGTLNVAFLRAVADNQPLWLSRKHAAELGYDLFGEGEMRACLPLRHRGRTFGVASVLWDEEVDLDSATRAYVSALVEAAGRRLTQLLYSAQGSAWIASPAAHWVDAVLEALPGNVALLCPVRDDSGAIVDWCFDRCSPQATDAFGRGAGEIVGRRLLESYPYLAGTGLLEAYEQTLRTGLPFEFNADEQVVARRPRPITSTFTVRGARFGDGVLAHWIPHDVELRQRQRLIRMERVGELGWAEWDLVTNAIDWSPMVYDILDREPADGPMKLGALNRYVHPQDRPVMERAANTLTRDRQAVDLEIRLQRRGTHSRVRFAADPVLDPTGRLVAVHAVLRRLS